MTGCAMSCITMLTTLQVVTQPPACRPELVERLLTYQLSGNAAVRLANAAQTMLAVTSTTSEKLDGCKNKNGAVDKQATSTGTEIKTEPVDATPGQV
jgi:hypothetical protein